MNKTKTPVIGTTILSSKGQVVIPENVRESLDLRKGTCFIVKISKKEIVFKVVK